MAYSMYFEMCDLMAIGLIWSKEASADPLFLERVTSFASFRYVGMFPVLRASEMASAYRLLRS